jgi:hypothetical protein
MFRCLQIDPIRCSQASRFSGHHGSESQLSQTFQNLQLDEAQCLATFPALLKDMNDQVGRGTFTMKMLKNREGPLQVRIKNHQASLPA